MKKLLLITAALILLSSGLIYSGVPDSVNAKVKVPKLSLYAGMGISMLSTSNFTNYIKRVIPFTSSDSIKNFNAGIEFFGGFEYNITKNFALKLDYSYYTRSISYTYLYYYNFSIVIHQSYLMGFYAMHKPAFDLKFGAGAGFHYSSVSRQIGSNSSISFYAPGVGFRGEIVFAPYMSKQLQAYLGVFLSGAVFSSLKDSNGNYLTSDNSSEQVNLNSFGIGARIGFSYIIK